MTVRVPLFHNQNAMITVKHICAKKLSVLTTKLNSGLKRGVTPDLPFNALMALSASFRVMKATKPQLRFLLLSSSVLGHMILTLARGPYFPNSSHNISSSIWNHAVWCYCHFILVFISVWSIIGVC